MSNVVRLVFEVGFSIFFGCIIFVCLALFDQSALANLGQNENTMIFVCGNDPSCVLKGSNPLDPVCGNASDGGTTGGGRCDPNNIVCVCQLSFAGLCKCSN